LAIATTLVARRDSTLVVPSGMGRDRLDQRLLRLVGGDLLEARDRHETTSRAGRLELAQWHCFYTLPNNPSIFWPGPRVTIAFFHSAVWPIDPMRRLLRGACPLMVTVFTSRTLIPCAWYCSSRAFLMSVLEACGATRNVYRPWV